jgi:hypothetical protein
MKAVMIAIMALAASAGQAADRLGPLPAAPAVATPNAVPATSAAPAAPAPAVAAPADELNPAVNTSPAAPRAATTAGNAAATNTAANTAGTRSRVANDPTARDRVELQNTQITGNQELPRVMYVVPWKRPDQGDLTGVPANSLLDELLEPVDRDVFRRQVRYFEALQPDAPAGGATVK